MEGKIKIIDNETIESKILFIRGQKVMLDRDLARLYGVETRAIIQAVKRNKKRFPDDFMFQLTNEENVILRSHIVISNGKNSENKPSLKSQFVISKRGGIRYLPYVFTEQGVAMLSSVLNSERAILVNIAIMRTFVNIRKFVSSYEGLAMKIAELEKKYDKKIIEIFDTLDKLTKTENKERREIGFEG